MYNMFIITTIGLNCIWLYSGIYTKLISLLILESMSAMVARMGLVSSKSSDFGWCSIVEIASFSTSKRLQTNEIVKTIRI